MTETFLISAKLKKIRKEFSLCAKKVKGLRIMKIVKSPDLFSIFPILLIYPIYRQNTLKLKKKLKN